MYGQILAPLFRYERRTGEMTAVEDILEYVEKRPLLCDHETFAQEREQTRV